jgi:predicted Zn-dependent peptidase
MGHPDWIAADLLSSVLSGDKASRLEKALVLEQQIATDVSAYVLPTEATGIFMVQATANEGIPIEDIERAIDAELTRIASDGITADELTRAKNRAEVEHAHQIENYDSRADMIGMMATYFSDPSLIHTWLDPYRTTTGGDLQRVARQYLVAGNRVTSTFVPENA